MRAKDIILKLKELTTLLFAGVVFSIMGGFSCFQIRAKGDEKWGVISSYTTYYNEKEGGRCENIKIAALLIDKITVQAYGEFSFNKTVGRRTADAGFQQAKIIVNGEYVQGVGGGVCQVSTTLYNAALKSGLTVTEFHPHSLRVGYIPPSRDAMVSTESDFCFFNPFDFPVRILVEVFQGGIRISFLGKGNGKRYELSSNVLEEILPPDPIVKEGEAEKYLRLPKKGMKSELYLEEYEGKALLSRKRLRTDVYMPVQGIIIKKIDKPTNKILSNDCLF